MQIPLHYFRTVVGNHFQTYTAQKMKFFYKDFFSKCDQIRIVNLITFTEENLYENLHFLCTAIVICDYFFIDCSEKNWQEKYLGGGKTQY